jgi:hypothetical protein
MATCPPGVSVTAMEQWTRLEPRPGTGCKPVSGDLARLDARANSRPVATVGGWGCARAGPYAAWHQQGSWALSSGARCSLLGGR